jgi:hypothetical protein
MTNDRPTLGNSSEQAVTTREHAATQNRHRLEQVFRNS